MKLGRRFNRAARPYVVLALASAFFIGIAGERSDAHKPVTSKYDYNRDVFPLLRIHCARCHVPGGPAPMTLMTYNDAVPWAQAIRDEITAGRMPPWPGDPTSPRVKGGYPINSRDLDMIVVWASGGTPQGDLGTKLPAVTFDPQWKLGPPDLLIPMDAEHTVVPGNMEETCDFSLPVPQSGVTDTKWVKAADLMPGTASIVRDAVISIENGPALALWEPGSDATAAPSDAAFRLAPGSKIHLQIHYKKHFDQEQNAVSDKSTVGLYFTDPPPSGRELESFAIGPAQAGSPTDAASVGVAAHSDVLGREATGNPSESSSFAGTLPGAARIVALRPMLDRAYESLIVEAILPSGMRTPLLRLHGPRPQWPRRYWLEGPVALAGDTKIEVRVTPLSDYSEEPKAAKRFMLQVILDYVPQ